MDVLWYPEPAPSKARVITVGNFDGVHRGHAALLETLVAKACARGATPTVVTFYPHPREVIENTAYPVLTPLDEQVRLLSEVYGVEEVAVLPFDNELRSMEPRAFYERILIPYLNPGRVIVGSDHRFGRQGRGGVELLRALGAERNIPIESVAPYADQRGEVGSRRIKSALRTGDPETAHMFLGRPYTLTGHVTSGKGFGRTIGFPTANIVLDSRKLLPKRGVYAVAARLQGESTPRRGVLNVGYNPVVEDRTDPAVEVYLLDTDKDIYGQTVTLELLTFIRPEYEGGDVENLREWIAEDVRYARAYLNNSFD